MEATGSLPAATSASDLVGVVDDRVLLAHGSHHSHNHLGAGFGQALQQLSDHRCCHQSQRWRDSSAGQERGRSEQHELANAGGAGQCVPQGPCPTHGVAGKRRRVQSQLVENVVDEFDGSFAEALAGNTDGVAQPEPRPVYCDRPHAFKTLQQGKKQER